MKDNTKGEYDKAQIAQGKILDAAQEVFAEKGFDGARVDEIAKRAGVNKALLYYYFENKQMLLEELVKNNIREFKALREQVFKDINSLNSDVMGEFLEETFKFLEEKKHIIGILGGETLKAGSEDVSMFKLLLPSVPRLLEKMKKMGVDMESVDAIKILTHIFYFEIIPLCTYFTLSEKWSNFYGISKSESDEKFIELYKRRFLKKFDELIK